ncbi:MAG: ABC transporter substrate-binding protein [Chloroflexi bacterium]|nr:ABC transporter substrate-binding protein [Chloroflexota bacterium]
MTPFLRSITHARAFRTAPRRARFVARAAAVAALAAFTALAAACGGGDVPATPATSPSETAAPATSTAASAGGTLLTVTLMLDWTPNNNHAGIYAARAQGWYRDAGLDVRIVEPASSGTAAVVGAGQAEFGISVAEALLPARAAGVPIVSIATVMPHNDSSLMALAATGITRPRDLAGKTYGGYGGSLERELIDTLIRCDGGDPTTVTFVDVGNVDYISGMEQGRYDFVWVFEGWDALRAREVLGKQIATIKFIDHADCIPDWYTPVIIAGESMIADHPDTVRAFVEATARGYQFALEHPAETAAALLAAAPELDPALVNPAATYYATRYTDPGQPWGIQDPEVWTRFATFLRTAGLLEQDIDVTKAYTNDFLPAQGR